ncbi:MAG: DUF4286 family protein [Bacteroidetes bacterium]|nr:DUF4286 family protein [Bacteroidota bacterium]
MILYNVTINVDDDVHDEWLHWMKTVHVPDVLATGCFMEGRIFRINVEEQQGKSYSFQYRAATIDDYERYKTNHAPALQKDVINRYNGKFVAFRTVLEEVK